MIPHDAICWEYKWLDVPLFAKTMTLSSFLQVGNQKLFRLGLKCSEDFKTIKAVCFCENKLLNQHFGVSLQIVTCTFHKAEMVMEMLQHKDLYLGRSNMFAGTFENVPAVPDVITSSSFTFHFHLKGIVDHYSPDRFDSFLADQLWEACEKKHQTDILFKVGDRSFWAHKFILAARSPVLAAMFHADMIESRTGTVEIDDVDPDIFRQFLRFVYTGQVNGPFSKELKRVADKYDVKTLMSLCKAAAEVPQNPDDVDQVVQFVSVSGFSSKLDQVVWSTYEFSR